MDTSEIDRELRELLKVSNDYLRHIRPIKESVSQPSPYVIPVMHSSPTQLFGGNPVSLATSIPLRTLEPLTRDVLNANENAETYMAARSLVHSCLRSGGSGNYFLVFNNPCANIRSTGSTGSTGTTGVTNHTQSGSTNNTSTKPELERATKKPEDVVMVPSHFKDILGKWKGTIGGNLANIRFEFTSSTKKLLAFFTYFTPSENPPTLLGSGENLVPDVLFVKGSGTLIIKSKDIGYIAAWLVNDNIIGKKENGEPVHLVKSTD